MHDHQLPLATSLGEALEECYAGSLTAWRNKYAHRTRVNDLLGHDLKEVTLQCIHRRGGRCMVYVTIIARLRSQNDTYFYSLQRTGESNYVRVAQTEV